MQSTMNGLHDPQDDGTLKNSFRIPESAVMNAIGTNNYNEYVGAAFRLYP